MKLLVNLHHQTTEATKQTRQTPTHTQRRGDGARRGGGRRLRRRLERRRGAATRRSRRHRRALRVRDDVLVDCFLLVLLVVFVAQRFTQQEHTSSSNRSACFNERPATSGDSSSSSSSSPSNASLSSSASDDVYCVSCLQKVCFFLRLLFCRRSSNAMLNLHDVVRHRSRICLYIISISPSAARASLSPRAIHRCACARRLRHARSVWDTVAEFG